MSKRHQQVVKKIAVLFSSFQAPHQPWYGQLMFTHVQLGYGGYFWPSWLPNAQCQAYYPELVVKS